jgi:hypothetical protein
MEKLLLSNSVVFRALSWTGTRAKTSKPPRFTKSGQEPECGHENALFSRQAVYVIASLQLRAQAYDLFWIFW